MTNQSPARSIIREKAFQVLYLMKTRPNLSVQEAVEQTLSGKADSEAESLEDMLKANMPDAYKADKIVADNLNFLKTLVSGVTDNQDDIDDLISHHLTSRPLNRIDHANHVALSIGVYELKFNKELPTSVVMDEAIELTKRFNDDKAGKFVNGVLQAIIDEEN